VPASGDVGSLRPRPTEENNMPRRQRDFSSVAIALERSRARGFCGFQGLQALERVHDDRTPVPIPALEVREPPCG
jgi:hypothetical protein